MISGSITIPPPDELRRRIRACQTELQELRRLLRMAMTAERAAQARRDGMDGTEAPGGRSDDRSDQKHSAAQ
jgi:hypothetical protein